MRISLIPLRSAEVHFSGRYRCRDVAGNLLLRPAVVGGRKLHHIWLNAQKNEVLTAPFNSWLSGFAKIEDYERGDGTFDLGLTGAHELEVVL